MRQPRGRKGESRKRGGRKAEREREGPHAINGVCLQVEDINDIAQATMICKGTVLKALYYLI